ncbi:MAG: threonine synthase [Bacteroidales bacterium]
MKYYNINDQSEKVSLREAVLKSSPNISGLYMPERIPQLPDAFFKELPVLRLQEIAVESSKAMFGDDVPTSELERIVSNALNFDIPLRQLDENLFVLELFHGPTMAFKDVGARFMAGLFEYFLQRDVVVLVATSGDTGSAVANAFYNRKGVRVVILYPSGRVSEFQEKQITTMGGNITALEVDGDFDDCQRLVKQAFSDADINSRITLTSANSINFARLFPQSFYYLYAVGQLWRQPDCFHGARPVAISVPSGNFGNLTAGLIAKRMGLSVSTFIVANNLNHSVADYLNEGHFEPRPTQHTITNAMDVGNPSNFARILDLYKHSHRDIASDIKGYWFTDVQTCEALSELQKKFGYQADPHGAVAYLALKNFMEEYPENRPKRDKPAGIFLETAHPAKFSDSVEMATGKKAQIPADMKVLMGLYKKSIKISNNLEDLKKHIFHM